MKNNLARINRNEKSFESTILAPAPELNRVQVLNEANTEEVLNFLSARPVHTVVMTSFIHDNGIENDANRGKFFGYRSQNGSLEGVALIGHTTLFEARTDEAILAFAMIAKNPETPLHLIMSEGNDAEKFWKYFSNGIRTPRLVCNERLFEMSFPVAANSEVAGMRNATEAELIPVATAHADVAFEESGVNPLETDREGYLKRVLRRIEQGRSFVIFENDELLFKADIVAQTDDVRYLEGVWVAPRMRGQGFAAKCLNQLGRELLKESKYVCLLSNVGFLKAHRAFEKAGFRSKDCCTTIFA